MIKRGKIQKYADRKDNQKAYPAISKTLEKKGPKMPFRKDAIS
jgi:hypothetical protein